MRIGASDAKTLYLGSTWPLYSERIKWICAGSIHEEDDILLGAHRRMTDSLVVFQVPEKRLMQLNLHRIRDEPYQRGTGGGGGVGRRLELLLLLSYLLAIRRSVRPSVVSRFYASPGALLLARNWISMILLLSFPDRDRDDSIIPPLQS